MKRKIALLLALVMVLSMVPMMSFAASDNSVNRVPSVAKDAELKGPNAPKLRIEEKRVGEFGEEVFRLTLNGAEWLEEELEGINVPGLNIDYSSSSRVTVTVYGPEVTTNNSGKKYVEIPLYTKITEEGEATVTIDSRGSTVTGGKYVFANVAEGSTVTSVDGTVTFAQERATLKTFEVDETKLGGFKGDKKLKFILSRDFVWSDSKADIVNNIDFIGGYAGYTITVDDIEIDGEELNIKLDGLYDTSSTRLGTIVFNNMEIEAKRDAKLGEVTLKVRGDASNQELVVGKYVDYNVIVEADGDAKEIFAGKLDKASSYKNDTHELQKLIIKEEVKGAWITDRKVVVEFPSFVKVIGVDVKKSDKLDIEEADFDFDENVVEFIPKRDEDGKAKLEVIFYVSVEADATGDITAKVTGRGLADEQEVVLGKALAPVEVKVDVKDVRLGVQRQELGKITLNEVKDGGVKKGLVVLELEDGFRWAGTPTVKVTDGDLRIDERSAKVNRNVLTFEVTRASDKASAIEITDVAVDLYRTLPEGDFRMYVGGSALVENYDSAAKAEDPEFRTQWLDEVTVARVTTPAPGETTTPEVVLTIGNTTMFVDGVSTTASAAPYIDENNRTMLPVSAIGRVLGANVDWNASARTVLITKDDNRVLLTIDKDVMNVNGMEIPMRSKAVITGDRTFVPLKDLGVALGVNIEWDAATQTVTVK